MHNNSAVLDIIQAHGEPITVVKASYSNGRIAITLVCSDGEPWGTFSVNLPDSPIEADEVIVKAWGENEALRAPMLATGLFEDTGKRIETGFVEAEVWRMRSRTN